MNLEQVISEEFKFAISIAHFLFEKLTIFHKPLAHNYNEIKVCLYAKCFGSGQEVEYKMLR